MKNITGNELSTIVNVFELIIYIVYLYLLMYISIHVKPNIFTLSLLFAYCFYTTWNLYIGCNSDLLKVRLYKVRFLKILFTLGYSTFCISAYYILYHSWKIYKSNKYYKAFLLGVPFYYYVAVHMAEILFKCDKFHTIAFPFKFTFKMLS